MQNYMTEGLRSKPLLEMLLVLTDREWTQMITHSASIAKKTFLVNVHVPNRQLLDGDTGRFR
jgi:hypothetical protein